MAADNVPIMPGLETAEGQQKKQGNSPAPEIESQGRNIIIESPANDKISAPA